MRVLLGLILLVFTLKAGACDFSVGTINLWHYPNQAKERQKQLEAQLKKDTPDIMAFTEAFKFIHGFSLYEDFLRLTGYKGQRIAANDWGIVEDGIADASHFPVIKRESFKLPATTINSRQALLVTTFDVCSEPLTVITAHLSPFKKNEHRRMAQMQFIVEKMRSLEGDVILAGDLNDSYDSKVFAELKSLGFDDVMPALTSTYDAKNPYAKGKNDYRLDYIFFHPKQLQMTKPAEVFFREHLVSDHFGLRASFARK